MSQIFETVNRIVTSQYSWMLTHNMKNMLRNLVYNSRHSYLWLCFLLCTEDMKLNFVVILLFYDCKELY